MRGDGARALGVTVPCFSRRALFVGGTVLAAAACTDGGDADRDIRTFGDVLADGSETLSRSVAAAEREGFAIKISGDTELRLTRPVTIRGGVCLKGSGAVTAAADMARILTIEGARTTINGIAVRAGDSRVGTIVAVGTRARGVTLSGLTVEGGGTGIALDAGTRDVHVRNSRVNGTSNGISMRGDVRGVRIEGCEFENWRDRAVWVVGQERSAPESIVVDGCRIQPPSSRGRVRQAIQVNGNDERLIPGVKVTNNRVWGLGTSYNDHVTPGSADLISLHRCHEFLVQGNWVTDGGDAGITVSQQSRDGVIEGNVCRRNDSVGICVGSRSSASVSDIVVRNNVCEGNGRDRLGDGKAWNRAGILVVGGDGIVLQRNRLRDTGHGTQVNAISLRGSKVTLDDNDMIAPSVTVLKDSASVLTKDSS